MRTGDEKTSTFRLKGTSGPVLNRTWPIQDVLRIGGSQDCELVLEERDIPATLAEIRVSPEGAVRIRALDPDVGVFLNGKRIEESALAGGDELRVGTSRLVLQAPGLRPDRVLTGAAVRRRRPAWPWLLLLAGALTAALAWQRGWVAF